MKSRHLVDPELWAALDALPTDAISTAALPDARARFATMRMPPLVNRTSGAIERRELFVPGPAGAPDVRVLVYTHKAPGARRPAYFQIHGGGYFMGSPDVADLANEAVAAALGCVVVAVDYRLAPETTFPGNLHDCYAALQWLHEHAHELGADERRIAIGGESAGGGLTAALALYARDQGKIHVIHQQLIYPTLDDRAPAEPHPFAGEFGWTAERSRFGWRCLLGREPGGDDVSPYAAPARAASLAGLPPAFISVGALDLLLEENLEYARRLTRAGVPVELHVYPGAFHGSDLVPDARVTRQHARDQIEALRVAFARSASDS